MNSEVIGAARRVPIEMVNMYPSALAHAIQDVTRNLIDRVVCELEKGESVCSLSTPEQIQKDDLYSVEIRRTVKIERLVRCRDCQWYDPLDKSRPFFCPVMDCVNGVMEDDYCSRGERRAKMEVQE